MNRFVVIPSFLLLLSSCIGKHSSNAQKATITDYGTAIENHPTGDTIKIDITKSALHWKGTKMRGAGKHEGDIELKSGYLIVEGKDVVNGNFKVDMTTVGVTDIPEHEPVPRKNLNNHLKSEDFFNVEKFPLSEFQMTNVSQITSDSLMVSGNLTLKAITKNIAFRAKYQGKSFEAKFTFDRFQWNIAYKGNFEDKTLVDKDIEMTIKLEME